MSLQSECIGRHPHQEPGRASWCRFRHVVTCVDGCMGCARSQVRLSAGMRSSIPAFRVNHHAAEKFYPVDYSHFNSWYGRGRAWNRGRQRQRSFRGEPGGDHRA